MMRANRKRNVKMPQFTKLARLNLTWCLVCCREVMSDKVNNAFRNHLLRRQWQIMRFVLTNQVYRVLVRARKGLDYIVANDVSDPDTTFGSDQNAVHLIGEDEAHYLPLATKQVIAERIVSLVAHHLAATSRTSS